MGRILPFSVLAPLAVVMCSMHCSSPQALSQTGGDDAGYCGCFTGVDYPACADPACSGTSCPPGSSPNGTYCLARCPDGSFVSVSVGQADIFYNCPKDGGPGGSSADVTSDSANGSADASWYGAGDVAVSEGSLDAANASSDVSADASYE